MSREEIRSRLGVGVLNKGPHQVMGVRIRSWGPYQVKREVKGAHIRSWGPTSGQGAHVRRYRCPHQVKGGPYQDRRLRGPTLGDVGATSGDGGPYQEINGPASRGQVSPNLELKGAGGTPPQPLRVSTTLTRFVSSVLIESGC